MKRSVRNNELNISLKFDSGLDGYLFFYSKIDKVNKTSSCHLPK